MDQDLCLWFGSKGFGCSIVFSALLASPNCGNSVTDSLCHISRWFGNAYSIITWLLALVTGKPWLCEHGTEEFSQGSQLFKLHVVVKTKLVHYTVLGTR